jgi:hypothetical protein
MYLHDAICRDAKGFQMTRAARRRQPPITIRSTRATALLRRLAIGGRSQVEIIEEALERMASQRISLADALAPALPQDFEWEPTRSSVAANAPNFDD